MSLEIPGDEQFLSPNVIKKVRNNLLLCSSEAQSKIRGIYAWGKKGRLIIDNKCLDEFLNFFKTNDCRLTDCAKCLYCYEIAKKVVVVKDNFAAAQLKRGLKDCAELFLDNKMAVIDNPDTEKDRV
jgi:hypothetical protein